jgi:hypothetical protein
VGARAAIFLMGRPPNVRYVSFHVYIVLAKLIAARALHHRLLASSAALVLALHNITIMERLLNARRARFLVITVEMPRPALLVFPRHLPE